MQASTKRAFSLLLSALLLVAALFVYSSLIRPEYQAVLQLRGELISKTNLLSKQQVVMSQVQNLIAQYRGVEKLGESLALALPQEEALSSVMLQLNALAQFSGLSIQSVGINYLPVKSVGQKSSLIRGLGTLRLDLRLFGDYAGLKKFLPSLETNIRLMDVQSLKLEAGSKTEQDLYSYLLTVDTYYQPK